MPLVVIFLFLSVIFSDLRVGKIIVLTVGRNMFVMESFKHIRYNGSMSNTYSSNNTIQNK
jgi:hypothetical protein